MDIDQDAARISQRRMSRRVPDAGGVENVYDDIPADLKGKQPRRGALATSGGVVIVESDGAGNLTSPYGSIPKRWEVHYISADQPLNISGSSQYGSIPNSWDSHYIPASAPLNISGSE